MRDTSRKALELFITNAQKVDNSNFLKVIKENGLNFSIRFHVDEPTILMTTTAPTGEEITALVTTMRKFQLGKESSSFVNLEKQVANDPDVSDGWKDYFRFCSNQWEKEIDQPTRGAVGVDGVDGELLTRRKLLDTFIYGGMLHDDLKHIAQLEKWQASGIFPVIENAFHHALLDLWLWVIQIGRATMMELAGEHIPPVAEIWGKAAITEDKPAIEQN